MANYIDKDKLILRIKEKLKILENERINIRISDSLLRSSYDNNSEEKISIKIKMLEEVLSEINDMESKDLNVNSPNIIESNKEFLKYSELFTQN